MDLPALNNLEKIYLNTDTGADAIRKLVKNQNLIEQGIKEAELIEGPEGPQGEQGPQGYTPYIGDNGNWWINGADTGYSASGAQDLTDLKAQVATLVSQVSTLISSINGLKFYTSISQINSAYTITTSIVDVYTTMSGNSIAMYLVGGTTSVYPAQFGQCIIFKSASNRDMVLFTDSTTGKVYKGTCHVSFTSGFSGWTEI